MILEGLDGTFGGVAAMTMGWYKLEINAFLAKVTFESSRGFVVQALVSGCESSVDEVGVE
jgi:UDP-N-acetylenolpyruvoylglucosamine reductase